MLIRLQGGLGNQLFQLLAARYYQAVNGNEIFIYPGDMGDFKTARTVGISPLLKNEHLIHAIKPIDKFLFKTKVSKFLGKFSLHSISTVKQLEKWNGQILNGYFHDLYNYPDHYLLHKLVTEIGSYLEKVGNVDESFLPFKTSDSCAIHLRLTDFLQINQGEDFLHSYRLPYINKAIDQLRMHKGVEKFVIFSDDVTVAKGLLKGNHFIFFNDMTLTPTDLLTEFNLISKFKYLITSNSTFSYWTSILGEQKTIYFPAVWKNDDKMENATFNENIRLHNQIFLNDNTVHILS